MAGCASREWTGLRIVCLATALGGNCAPRRQFRELAESIACEAVFGVTATAFSRPTCAENFTAASRMRVAAGRGLSAAPHGNSDHAARNGAKWREMA